MGSAKTKGSKNKSDTEKRSQLRTITSEEAKEK